MLNQKIFGKLIPIFISWHSTPPSSLASLPLILWMEDFIINLIINQMNFVTKVLKPRTFLLVKMSICGGEACRPSLMVAIQRWWRVWAAGRGGAGAGMHLLYCPTLSCCSALRPGPGPSNSEHNTGSDPPAILMLGNIFPPAILIVGDKIPPAIQMLKSEVRAAIL